MIAELTLVGSQITNTNARLAIGTSMPSRGMAHGRLLIDLMLGLAVLNFLQGVLERPSR